MYIAAAATDRYTLLFAKQTLDNKVSQHDTIINQLTLELNPIQLLS